MAERLNRTVVVERAADLADKIGLDKLTITKLGHALGIAPPGVYRHVTDLDDLRRAIAQQAARDLAKILSIACTGLSGKDAIAALAHSLRGWAENQPARYAALQIAPDTDDAAGVAAADELIAVVASALRAYQLEGDDLTDAVRLLRSTLHGFVTLELGDGFKQPRPTSVTFERISSALDTVLQEWSS